MNKKQEKEERQKKITRNVWLITIFSLLIFISGGYFFYQFMQGYSYRTYLKEAQACLEQKQYQCAVVNANLAEEFKGNGVELLELKAKLFLDYYKNDQKAIEHYSLALANSDQEVKRAELLFKRAKVYHKQDKLELCKADLLTASKTKTIDSVHLYLAEIYNYSEHNYSEAIAHYLAETALKEQSFILKFGLAFAYYNNKEYKKAITIFDRALELVPTSGEAFYFRALSYNSINEQKKACVDYQAAIKLGYSRAVISYDALCNF